MSNGIKRLIIAQSLSRYGDNIEYIALCLLCYQMTHNAISIGIVSLMCALPNIIFTLLGGAVAEKINKPRLMCCCEVLRMMIIMIIPLTLAYNNIFIVYAVVFCISVAESFFEPCSSAYISCAVNNEEYAKISCWLNSISQIVSIAGLATGGVFVSFFGLKIAFVFDALTFFISAIICFTLKKTDDVITESKKSNIVEDIVVGIKAVHKKKSNRVCMVYLVIIAILISPIEPYVTKIMGQKNTGFDGDYGVGILFAILSCGVILGSVIGGYLNNKIKFLDKVVSFISLIGILCISKTDILYLIAGCFITGIVAGYLRTFSVANLMTSLAEGFRGRVASIIIMIALCGTPLFTLLSSYCIEKGRTMLLWIIEAIIIFISTFYALFVAGENEKKTESI